MFSEASNVERLPEDFLKGSLALFLFKIPSEMTLQNVDWLSLDEAQRAANYRSDHRKNWFLISRLLSRSAVASLTGMQVDQQVWAVKGIPSVRSTKSSRKICSISVSHSRDSLAVIMGPVHEKIGVDIEFSNPDFKFPRFDELVLSEAEQRSRGLSRSQSSLPGDSEIRIWTAKEAAFKSLHYEQPISLHQIELENDFYGSSKPAIWEWSADGAKGVVTSLVFEEQIDKLESDEVQNQDRLWLSVAQQSNNSGARISDQWKWKESQVDVDGLNREDLLNLKCQVAEIPLVDPKN